ASVEQVVRRVCVGDTPGCACPADRDVCHYLLSLEVELTDSMVNLLVETVHKIDARSKRKVMGDIAKDTEQVYGKEPLLFEIASASIEEPSGRACDVIFLDCRQG